MSCNNEVLGEIDEVVKKAMWLYPKFVGNNNNNNHPSERWGHSSSFFKGHLYVFGGCCGGMHFSDVLSLNLETMAWTTLVTIGSGPGPRDSHSATIWGNKMIVFGGTNGSKKVNDIHILDLGTKEWVQPRCGGTPPPSPRESHTAILVEDDKLVVFGGSGEGVGNYLNDLHVLHLKTMIWTSPNVKGQIPPPRDSHTSIVVGRKMFVYGGDCGDRYHGDVDVLDIDTLTWTTLEVCGSSPGRRAGHSAVRIGTKMYIIGGVGDKKYYSDSWVLDTTSNLWSKLEISGHSPQGRFSHTAVVTDSDIAIYGGCGEDERPLGELLILQLGNEHPNGRYNISMCKTFGNRWNQGRQDGLPGAANGLKTMLLGSYIEAERKHPNGLEYSDSKRLRRSINVNNRENESEPDEHSLSLSQNSSPSQSDQEQTTLHNPTVSQNLHFPTLNHPNKSPEYHQNNKTTQEKSPDMYIVGERRADTSQGHLFPSSHSARRDAELQTMRQEYLLPSSHPIRDEAELVNTVTRPVNHTNNQNMLGADVQGKVDGAFDSGYLMTATVNGRIFRGVLFSAGSNIMSRGPNQNQNVTCGRIPVSQSHTNVDRTNPIVQSNRSPGLGCNTRPRLIHEKINTPSPIFRAVPSRDRELRNRSDLQGVVLTLGGPTSSFK